MRAPPDGYTLPLVGPAERDQRDALRESQLQFHPRHRAGRQHHARAARHGGQPVVPGQDGSRIHRLRQGQSGQGQHGVGRHRHADHVAGELFKMMTGIKMMHVPYRGAAPALTDLLGGQVQVMFDTIAGLDRAHQGRQAARAGGDHRDARRRCCRTCRPSASSCRATRRASWYGVGAPKNTPAEIIDKLNKEINAASPIPEIKARLADSAACCLPGSPADFGKLIAEETEKWAKVVKFSGAKPN